MTNLSEDIENVENGTATVTIQFTKNNQTSPEYTFTINYTVTLDETQSQEPGNEPGGE